MLVVLCGNYKVFGQNIQPCQEYKAASAVLKHPHQQPSIILSNLQATVAALKYPQQH